MLGAALKIVEPYSLMEIVNLSCNMDKFALYPDAHNEVKLGQYLLKERKIDIPDDLIRYVDYALVGGGYADDHAGCFSDSGYTVRTGEALKPIYDGK